MVTLIARGCRRPWGSSRAGAAARPRRARRDALAGAGTPGRARSPPGQAPGPRGRARRARRRGWWSASREPLPEVVTDPERVRHDGERRVHGTARGEEARVDDVEVVDLVGLAVDVEGRGLGIPAEAHGTVLMRHAGQRDARRDVGVQGNQVVVAADLLEHALEL